MYGPNLAHVFIISLLRELTTPCVHLVILYTTLYFLNSANALSGVPDGRGGVLPAIKQQLSPTGGEDRLPFLSSPVGSGPPPLNIQRQTPGSFLGGRPLATAPAGASGLPRGLFTGATPVRPVRQVCTYYIYTVESGYLAHALIGITAKLYAPHSEVR